MALSHFFDEVIPIDAFAYHAIRKISSLGFKFWAIIPLEQNSSSLSTSPTIGGLGNIEATVDANGKTGYNLNLESFGDIGPGLGMGRKKPSVSKFKKMGEQIRDDFSMIVGEIFFTDEGGKRPKPAQTKETMMTTPTNQTNNSNNNFMSSPPPLVFANPNAKNSTINFNYIPIGNEKKNSSPLDNSKKASAPLEINKSNAAPSLKKKGSMQMLQSLETPPSSCSSVSSSASNTSEDLSFPFTVGSLGGAKNSASGGVNLYFKNSPPPQNVGSLKSSAISQNQNSNSPFAFLMNRNSPPTSNSLSANFIKNTPPGFAQFFASAASNNSNNLVNNENNNSRNSPPPKDKIFPQNSSSSTLFPQSLLNQVNYNPNNYSNNSLRVQAPILSNSPPTSSKMTEMLANDNNINPKVFGRSDSGRNLIDDYLDIATKSNSSSNSSPVITPQPPTSNTTPPKKLEPMARRSSKPQILRGNELPSITKGLSNGNFNNQNNL